MKKTMLAGARAALLLLSVPASAQQMRLPAASPAAKVEQAVGLTDVSVEYSSPAVKGRPIWGALVPYGQPWRTGANMATKVTFSRDVTFGGKRVPAGSYALVSFPTQQGWTVALNKELGLFGGGKSYDAKLDVVKVPATTSVIPHRERLAFLFGDTTEDSTSLDLEWEKLRVSVPVKVDTAAHVKASIAEGMEATWRAPANAGRYMLEKKDYASALQFADTSIGVKSTWFNQWTRAEALAGLGRTAEAKKAAQTAWDLGNKDPGFFFRGAVSKALKEWK
jgi:hypothetical protein